MKEMFNRSFKLWAYTVSHSFLIVRSPMKFVDMDGYDESTNFNIDIEFTGVAYIDLPNLITEISIQEIENEIPARFIHYKNNLGLKIFEINTINYKYYVVASSCLIGKNYWLAEDRICKMSLEHDEIICSSN